MKRAIIIFLVFAALLGAMILSGCDGDNFMCRSFNLLGKCSYGLYNCVCNDGCNLMLAQEHELNNNEGDVIITRMENSDGTGRNGYITVRYAVREEILPQGLQLNMPYIKFNVLDSGITVGAVEYDSYDYLTLSTIVIDNVTYHAGYFNVEISEYINGNYTFEIESFAYRTYATDSIFDCD